MMPIELFWGDEQQTILHCQFPEMWTLEDYVASIDQMHEMIRSQAPRTVHILSDFSRSRSSPPRLLSTGTHIEKRRAVNMGINIIVGANGFIKSMLQAAQRMYLIDTRIHMVNSVEEAYVLIAQQPRKTRV
ncbi:MAG: hypothetical protein K8I30_09835 [Anaerolineae bacterium]|nr:hypothetical protein [Anaerolineae bacterium]